MRRSPVDINKIRAHCLCLILLHEHEPATDINSRAVPRGKPIVRRLNKFYAELGRAASLGMDRQSHGIREPLREQLPPCLASLDDTIGALSAFSLEGSSAPLVIGSVGILYQKSGDSAI
jgi:hypothetical protein